jgi:hypothetical protein
LPFSSTGKVEIFPAKAQRRKGKATFFSTFFFAPLRLCARNVFRYALHLFALSSSKRPDFCPISEKARLLPNTRQQQVN